MPNDPKTPPRTMRISDDVWEPAKARAASEGVATSTVVRRALIDYLGLKDVRGVEGRQDRKDGTDVPKARKDT